MKKKIKGNFNVTNPNFKIQINLLTFWFEAQETDKLTDFGYKTNKTGFSFGTRF